jgi:CRISPR/Cas system endoribonuclease Cas6 (RAMP superfamily)
MRLKLRLGVQGEPFRVPRHYNYPLQSLIYRYLDARRASHNLSVFSLPVRD